MTSTSASIAARRSSSSESSTSRTRASAASKTCRKGGGRMISDEERRQIANKLRKHGETGCISFQGAIYSALQTLPENTDGQTWLEYSQLNNKILLNKLADLIDPR